ncbi:MAG: flagellar protein FlaG [Burkholderiales bacterium]|nr:flagellar protein FlaG [Burkholderiales bacterium]
MRIGPPVEASVPTGTPRPPRDARPASGAPAPPARTDPRPESEPATDEQVDKAIQAANRFMQKIATNLKFEKDAESGRLVVRVIDSETKQVLRQMPSEEMLAISRALDGVQGLMLRQRA